MEFNIRQKKVIEATENKILCLSASGSGKTAVLTERIRHLITIRNVEPKDIIAVTFTNLAANEMKTRLGDVAIGMFIGTIHSLANSILISNGIDISADIAEGKFDRILERCCALPQSKFPKVKHLLVDEFQDTCSHDFDMFEKIRTDNFFAVGDDRQMIFGFRGASNRYVEHLYRDANCKVYHLNQNYRSAPSIIDFAENLICKVPKRSIPSIAVKTKKGYVNPNAVFLEAVEEMEWTGDWKNWAILCRTNAEVEAATKILNEKEIPNVSFKKTELEDDNVEALMKEDKVKILTIHAAKGLSFPHVIMTGAKLFNDDERRIAYVAATRAEQSLYWCPSINTGRAKKKTPEDFAKQGDRVFKSQGVIKFG